MHWVKGKYIPAYFSVENEKMLKASTFEQIEAN